jgi:membrane-associated protease RseP (regulator of RpoE activity)
VSLTPYLIAWRTTPLHDREVVDALVDPVHAAPSAELQKALHEWPGSYYWSSEVDGRHLVLTRPTSKQREAWKTHLALLIATLFTTTVSGAVMTGHLPPELSFLLHPSSWDMVFVRALAGGLVFSLPLLAILLSHELGHYLRARHYNLSVSPPFFLPGLPTPIGIGTFGAFIRLRTILTDRRQLLDVGAAGPLAGFAIALPVLWWGLAHSAVIDPSSSGMSVQSGWGLWPLGDSVVTRLLRALTHPGGGEVLLHPVAFAGWVGMFVTMLNLLPIAQLDGGHILYAALPRVQRWVARAIWVVIILLGYFSKSWLVWGAIVLLLSRGQFGHPPVLDAYRPLPKSRIWLLVASVLLFVLTFTPVPSP